MEWKNTSFAGHESVFLTNGAISLWITVDAGPRILGLSLPGGENQLVELPDVYQITPAGRRYKLIGGHRLWHAPEHPERSYVPDDAPVAVAVEADRAVSFTAPPEELTGVQKSLRIHLPDAAPAAQVIHVLTNWNQSPVTLAPWAITQLRPGGYAVLPQPIEDTGLLPNRRIALWPYTSVQSPCLEWHDRYIAVRAAMRAGKLKLGWANPRGWMAYLRNGTLFVKQAPFDATAEYVDFGSSSECYTDPRFLELETLGPLVTLQPGESVIHRERWSLFADVQLEEDPEAIQSFLAREGIES